MWLERVFYHIAFIVFIALDKGIFDTNIEYIADVGKFIFLCKTYLGLLAMYLCGLEIRINHKRHKEVLVFTT